MAGSQPITLAPLNQACAQLFNVNRQWMYRTFKVISEQQKHSEKHQNGTQESNEHNDAPPLLPHSPTPSSQSAQRSGALPPSTCEHVDEIVPSSQDVCTEAMPELEPELLHALGDAVDDIPIYGPDIHGKLAQRWLPILKKGLQAEIKEKLLKEYVAPDNCKLLKAPTLNPKISAAVADIVRARDRKLQTRQDQLGLGITAINKAMTLLLTGDDKVQAVKILSDSCRILTDLHFTETQVRSKLITPGLDKSFLAVIQNHERDETLFGNTLPDKIKASKAIERQGLQIKKVPNPKASTPSSSFAAARPRPQGNWSGPSRYQSFSRGGRAGSYRTQYRRAPASMPPPSTRNSTSSTMNPVNKRAPTRH
ncbi:uncharacterized protein LOC120636839 [Pararge aegeria]|uniref:uncharacterized protein LOC120636839 n=1 Tax=Pararge aegeria TaxID=116150 RepID=UPI0019D1C61D|nr:uncharacterized protein LOC120636839 [Pararge aegeria]